MQEMIKAMAVLICALSIFAIGMNAYYSKALKQVIEDLRKITEEIKNPGSFDPETNTRGDNNG